LFFVHEANYKGCMYKQMLRDVINDKYYIVFKWMDKWIQKIKKL